MNEPQHFRALAIETGLLLDLKDDVFPTRVYGWFGNGLELPDEATHYGMVTQGACCLDMSGETVHLCAGMFFVLPGSGRIKCSHGGAGLVISRLDYRGLFQIGGPVEAMGRLRYIDGCSDTLLVCPPLLGEPCLNHLHIPPR